MITRSRLAVFALACSTIAWVYSCSAGSDNKPYGPAGGSGGEAGTSPGASGTGGGLQLLEASTQDTPTDTSCGEAKYGALRVPASILLLLDRSGSMDQPMAGDVTCPCPAGGNTCQCSKWTGASKAVSSALADPHIAELTVGLAFFPAGAYGSDAKCTQCIQASLNGTPPTADCLSTLRDCGCLDAPAKANVPAGLLKDTYDDIVAALSSADPGGATPTYHALQAAYAFMGQIKAEGNRYVLLMTDGDPTVHEPEGTIGASYYPDRYELCKETADILQQTEAAAKGDASKGAPPIRTFVVGSPGVTSYQFMSDLAVAGDTARQPGCGSSEAGWCHYQIGETDFSAGLESVLREISGLLSTCVFAIPPITGEFNPDLVNVTVVGDEETDLYRDLSHTDGWDYTDKTQNELQVFGASCERIKSKSNATVSVLVGCQTRVK